MTIEIWKGPFGGNPDELAHTQVLTPLQVREAKQGVQTNGDPLTTAQATFRAAYIAANEDYHYRVVVDTDPAPGDSQILVAANAPAGLVYPADFGVLTLSAIRLTPDSTSGGLPALDEWVTTDGLQIRRNTNGTWDLRFRHRGGANQIG